MLKITLVTIGHKMPSWVNDAVDEYRKRLQDVMALNIVDIPLIRRGKSNDLARIMEKEMHLMRQAIPTGTRRIALDLRGTSFTSEQFATKLEQFDQNSTSLCLLIGGPEGLHPEILNHCDEHWSLSKLTLPHTLARIVLLEALYRAWSISNNHPYHK